MNCVNTTIVEKKMGWCQTKGYKISVKGDPGHKLLPITPIEILTIYPSKK